MEPSNNQKSNVPSNNSTNSVNDSTNNLSNDPSNDPSNEPSNEPSNITKPNNQNTNIILYSSLGGIFLISLIITCIICCILIYAFSEYLFLKYKKFNIKKLL